MTDQARYAITGNDMLGLLKLWQDWIVGDKVTEEDDKAVEALDFLVAYLPEHGVATMDNYIWPPDFGGEA